VIDRLLVANRGEIARRIIRTCRRLGIEAVAVHSDADAAAPHVREADAAVRLPGSSPADTYLRAELLVEAALRTGASAVHPGYGFLSEQAAFARAVEAAGLVFVGPPADAIEAMGSKTGAKAMMRAAGVPVLLDSTVATPEEIGVPALVKASAGGGGRGMRVVRSLDELTAHVESAAREAAAAFGDGTVFVERYVEGGRHVEIQVMADAHGTVVALPERDCTLQRRHQKLIEETPSSAVGPDLRARMGAAAVAAARAVGYRGAGTVEFLLERDGTFSFLEMNTRLQVEHPVTELVTGLDLVELQLLVAEGRPLPDHVGTAVARGHAIEARLCAEDPAAGYLPSSGTFTVVRFPDLEGVRVDSGIESGSVVTPHYDSMVAKVIAHGDTRDVAVRRLRAALRTAELVGPTTNREQLLRLLADLIPHDAEIDTTWVERSGSDAQPQPPAAVVAGAALALAAGRRAGATTLRHLPSGWRNHPALPQRQGVSGHDVRYRFDRTERLIHLEVDGAAVDPDDALAAARGAVVVEGAGGAPETVHLDHGRWALTVDPRFPLPDVAGLAGSLVAPMPGSVVRVLVEAGDVVRAGQPLVVLEAMKMEHQVLAPHDGVVAGVAVAARQQLDAGQPLLRLERLDAGADP